MTRTIHLAGGCFWGTEHLFRGLSGVTDVVSGYANGSVPNPTYEQVYTDTTGYAETVRVTFREEAVSLEWLLEVFLTVIDPLGVNCQGEDAGTRYRTGVYYTCEEDRAVAERVFRRWATRLGAPLAVELAPLSVFYPAEEYHQRYLDKHPGGYCHIPRKAFAYARAYQDLCALLEGETDPVARMAQTAALLAERFRFWWAGFYRVVGDELVLGPFQGPPACLRIARGRGVCGAAWSRRETVVVPDVEQFPGHIACSAASRSEIVVPVFGRETAAPVAAVLDIDSTEPGAFDATDARWLENFAALVL